MSRYRGLPSVDKVLACPPVGELLARYTRELVVEAVREELEATRRTIAEGGPAPTANEVAEAVASRQLRRWSPWPVMVINATGVLLHTNLGRAPLSTESIAAVAEAARGYSNLEMDMDDGRRGSRHDAVSALVQELTGAEAALVVNNNAGAMLLGLAAVASGREVVVSRGEAAEIGGGFRIPDVLRQSGARLVEIGTVNRTYAQDYARAVTPDTAAFLVVHRSNFRVVGFTHQPVLAEVAAIAGECGLPLLHDLGSGALLDTSVFGLGHEPMPRESLDAGADLVFFSGDKLLGGPQAGIVAGDAEMVGRLARHPLARALRADKLTLAALHATLLHYARGEAGAKIPIWQMVTASTAELKVRAQAWAAELGSGVEVHEGLATLGGGSLPDEMLETWVVGIAASRRHPGGPEGLAASLRTGTPPVIARIEDDRVLLDPRTVLPDQDQVLVARVRQALTG